MNRGFGELSRWFRCRFTLSLKKTEYVYFSGSGGHGVPPGGITIGGEHLRRVMVACFLGVWIDVGLLGLGLIDWSGQWWVGFLGFCGGLGRY